MLPLTILWAVGLLGYQLARVLRGLAEAELDLLQLLRVRGQIENRLVIRAIDHVVSNFSGFESTLFIISQKNLLLTHIIIC